MSDHEPQVSRRERQILDALFARGELSPADLAAELPDPPTATAARTMLHNLLKKRLVQRRKQGREYLYRPRVEHEQAGRSAMARVVQTFFGGSVDQAFSAYLTDKRDELSDDDLKRLARIIREARRQGR